ncbi:MAG: hypothetical protein AB1633_03050 [Elusimicrobiota bacterium]
MRKKFEYAIKVEGKKVWHGLNPKKKYREIQKKYPAKKVSISWETKEGILVCIL